MDHAFGLGYYGATAETAALAGQKHSVDVRMHVGMTVHGILFAGASCVIAAMMLWCFGSLEYKSRCLWVTSPPGYVCAFKVLFVLLHFKYF